MDWNKSNKRQGKNEIGISKNRNLLKQGKGKGKHKSIEIEKHLTMTDS